MAVPDPMPRAPQAQRSPRSSAPGPDPVRGARPQDWIGVALLALAVWVAFHRLSDAQFLNYDDPDYVTANPRVLQGLTAGSVAWAFRSLFIYWQPLTWLSYMLDIECAGPSAAAFHRTNLALHLVNTVLLFLALRRLTGQRWPSAVVAGLFALHPLHVESVAWISERKGLLAAGFFFLALWAYAGYARRPGPARYVVVAACFALGLMAKAAIVTLPCVLLLLDFWPLRRGPRRLVPGSTDSDAPGPGAPVRSWAFLVWEKVPLLALAAGSCAVTLAAQQQAQAMLGLARVPLGLRLVHAVTNYAGYLRKTVWPTDLAVFYPLEAGWSPGRLVLAAVVLGAITLLAGVRLRRQPCLAVGWCWFLGMLVPVIGIVQAGDQSLADRYTYVPLVGVFMAVVWGLKAALQAWGHDRRLGEIAAVAALGLCAWASARQVEHWQTTRTLFEHTLAVTRNNALAATVVGSLKAADGNFAEATNLFAAALAWDPACADAHLHWGQVWQRQGQIELAMARFGEAARLRPNYAEAHEALGALLLQQGRLDEALARFTSGLQARPESPSLQYDRALALHRLGRLDEALAGYGRALELNPGFAAARHGLAVALYARGRFAEAAAQYEAALQLGFDSPTVRLNLADALVRLGRSTEARDQFLTVLREKPGWPPVLARYAWFLATCPDPRVRDGAEALRLAEQVNQATGRREPGALRVLAAAQAETGAFDAAVATLREALALAQAANRPGLATNLTQLLQTCQDRQPVRDGP